MGYRVALLGVLLGFFSIHSNLWAQDARSSEETVTTLRDLYPDWKLPLTKPPQEFPPSEIMQESIMDSFEEQISNLDEESIAAARNSLEQMIRTYSQSSKYAELVDYLGQIDNQLAEIQVQLERENIPVAENLLDQVQDMYGTLSESALLNLAGADLALGSVGALIKYGQYGLAGDALNRAVNYIVRLESSGEVPEPVIKKLKNDVIITQQQVTMGKLEDAKIPPMVPGLASTQQNIMNTYYTIWNRTELPWRQNGY